MRVVQRVSVLRRRTIRKVLLLAAAAALAILAVCLIFRGKNERAVKADTNEGRVAYLAALGWEVAEDPVAEQTFRLPGTFPDVLKEYNALQKKQGFDLEKYAGKEINMYSYSLENPPGEGDYLCSLYVCKGKVIGGDIHSTAMNGQMTGIR